MIPNLIKIGKQILGSSLSLPAYGRAGQGQHLFLAAHFAKQNTLSKSAEKKPPKRGRGGRGVWGEVPPRPSRSEAPALLVQSRPPKKSFVFLLEEKSGARKYKKL